MTESRDRLAADLLQRWAGCVQRLIAAAPIDAVLSETGIEDRGHTTSPERQAIRAEAQKVVAAWLSRDLAAIAKAYREDTDDRP